MRTAPRLGAIVVIVLILILIAALPQRYHLMPNWLAYIEGAILIVPMVLVSLSHGNPVWRRVERVAEVVAIGGALLFNSANVLVAAYDLVENPSKLEPVALFYTSVAIWTGNVLIFTLIYWLIDRGGPDARINNGNAYPDFDFPGMDDEKHVAPGWQPGMIDYLFLGFTTNTAFSPTEAMPLTPRAKILVMMQSSISLITIAIVAARTINILK